MSPAAAGRRGAGAGQALAGLQALGQLVRPQAQHHQGDQRDGAGLQPGEAFRLRPTSESRLVSCGRWVSPLSGAFILKSAAAAAGSGSAEREGSMDETETLTLSSLSSIKNKPEVKLLFSDQ